MVRGAVFRSLQRRLEARGVPYETECTTAQGYVFLELYARFLNPKTYLGFPENSYTYVTSAQVGAFITDVRYETALPKGRYAASASDIFQADTAGGLQEQLILLGEVQGGALIHTWLEANAVTFSSYLLFAALGLSLVALRVLPALFR